MDTPTEYNGYTIEYMRDDTDHTYIAAIVRKDNQIVARFRRCTVKWFAWRMAQAWIDRQVTGRMDFRHCPHCTKLMQVAFNTNHPLIIRYPDDQAIEDRVAAQPCGWVWICSDHGTYGQVTQEEYTALKLWDA